MRKTRLLQESTYFCLYKTTKPNGKVNYSIRAKPAYSVSTPFTLTEVRDLLDPGRNKGGPYGTTWKYRNRQEAEHAFLMLLIKWA